MEVAQFLKSFRKKAGLSQKELAQKTGLSIATIQGYEQNKYKPKYETLRKIADALGVQPSELLGSPITVAVAITEKSASEYGDEIMKTFFWDYTRLNDTGRAKVAEYVKDLANNSEYNPNAGIKPNVLNRTENTSNQPDEQNQ